MSLLAFGQMILTSKAEKLKSLDFFSKKLKNNFYIRTDKAVSTETQTALETLCLNTQEAYVLFEITDSELDNTATKIFSPSYYHEENNHWIETIPTLWERLKSIETYFIDVSKQCNLQKCILFISEQGYPLKCDCKVIYTHFINLANDIYREYLIEKNGVPSLQIEISL